MSCTDNGDSFAKAFCKNPKDTAGCNVEASAAVIPRAKLNELIGKPLQNRIREYLGHWSLSTDQEMGVPTRETSLLPNHHQHDAQMQRFLKPENAVHLNSTGQPRASVAY